MDKVAEFINTRCYRQALARLCRLAQEPVEDGRKNLDNWERKHSFTHENPLFTLLDSDPHEPVTKSDLETDPLLWLQAIDEHCHRIFGPDSATPHDAINDGFGESKVLSLYPGFGGGRLTGQFGNLFYWLKHHRVIPLDNSHGIDVEVRDIPSGYKDWNACRFNSEIIRIGIVHFTDDIKLDIGYTDNNFFICNGINDEEQRLAAALEHIRKAHEAGVHLLIIPELTITANMRSAISERMMHLSFMDGEHHELSVPLIVPGSFHERCDCKWRNHAEALCGLDGTALFGSDKRERVTFNHCGELIESSPTPITCLSTPIGLIGMTICRDLFMGSSAAVLQSLPLDWLLVPSMSDKLGPHKLAAKTLHDTRGMVIAVANQQMPDAQEFDQGFVHHDKYEEGDPGLTIIIVENRTDSCLRLVR
jgi:predicted amidohydrolase